MSTGALRPAAGPDVAPGVAPIFPMLAKQTVAEFLRIWRIPAFSATSLLLPVMFYAFFGISHSQDPYAPGVKYGAFVMASMAAYSVSNVMVFSFGIGVANERGQKLDLLLRATPMPPAIYLLAKVLMGLFFGMVALVVLCVFASIAGGVRLEAVQWANLLWRLLLGSLPFLALGFAIGYLAGPNSAVAVVNLVYLPTAFCSGIFIPISFLPKVLGDIAPYLPLNRYGQLAWNAVGVKTDPIGTDLLWLLGFTVIFFAIAIWAYQREEVRKFG